MNAIAIAKMKAELVDLLNREFGNPLNLYIVLEIIKIVEKALSEQDN